MKERSDAVMRIVTGTWSMGAAHIRVGGWAIPKQLKYSRHKIYSSPLEEGRDGTVQNGPHVTILVLLCFRGWCSNVKGFYFVLQLAGPQVVGV